MEKRTTIFSIFVFLCLLTNSTYARTTEYENPKDTILDMMLYFDLKARQADKDYQGNGKTLATLGFPACPSCPQQTSLFHYSGFTGFI